jgi:hypothetical protein
MATTLLSSVALSVGQQTNVVTVTESDEAVTLELVSAQVGADSSQCRLVCLDGLGRVKLTLLIDGNGTEQKTIEEVDSDLTCHVECLAGSCRVTLNQLAGSEKHGEGAGALVAADIADAAIETAKLDAGAATLPKVGFAGLKVLAAVGSNGAGSITLTGTVVGDRLVAVFGAPTAGGAMLPEIVGTDFESVVTVVDEIQQSTADNLSANTYIFLLAPAAA